jgi:hypothetical protein
VKIFRRYEGTEVKTTLENSEFGNFRRFYVRWKVGFIGVASMVQSDYFWLTNIIIL